MNKLLVRNVKKYAGEGAFFVNIGANDGVSNDPIFPFIRRFNWRGIAVEPQPILFERLKNNLAGYPGIVFENVAIADANLMLYRVSDAVLELEPGLCQISSFSRQHVENFLKLMSEGKVQHEGERGSPLPPLHEMVQQIESMRVETTSFNALMEKHNVSRIDFLNIDTESYDFEVLSSIDLDRYSPRVLCIETSCFTRQQRKIFLQMMEQRGYRFLQRFGLPSEIYVREQ